jgi:hypothetical protein
MCKIEKDNHAGYGKTWTNSFKMGAASSITTRLKQASNEVKRAAVAQSSTALVKLDRRDADVDLWAEQNLKLKPSVKSNVSLDGGAYNSGQKAGNKIQLNKGIGGKSDPKQLS